MTKILTRALGVCLWLVLAGPALAQSPVRTSPQGVNGTIVSGSIATTNTFQNLWAASDLTPGRRGCIVSNLGASTMYLYLGAIANATTPKSIPIAAGTSFSCNQGAVVILNEVNITGTAVQFYSGIEY